MKKIIVLFVLSAIFIVSCGEGEKDGKSPAPASSEAAKEAVIENASRAEAGLASDNTASTAEQAGENTDAANKEDSAENGIDGKSGQDKAGAEKAAEAPDYKKTEKDLNKVIKDGRKRAGEDFGGNRVQKRAEKNAEKNLDQLEQADKITLKDIEKEAQKKNEKHNEFNKSKEKSKKAFDELDAEFN